MRRMDDLWMKLDAVEIPCIVGNGRERRAVANRHGAKARRQASDTVAVTHPYLFALAFFPQSLEKLTLFRNRDIKSTHLSGPFSKGEIFLQKRFCLSACDVNDLLLL